ncbi:hypothetical protein [Winogradskyella bathintestinalis]|uniref:Uncharacterized protein n=1 Tax=Winogradskyella bathintestinalis TaxID=3035208 RepID=A0ABT7ZZ42_9FLAO|nr:hypothetical protein [Winogradskyella bathintestinalis]MDN3494280.1 hypothetical protein [Winogradskyella bathintestinalis]
MKNILFLLMIFSLLSCKNKSRNYDSNSSYSSSYYEDEDGYTDGTYCAEIEYYYYKTGTRSTYTLEVEIEDNELTIIYWPNGGWLDDSHFYPPDISDGYAEFESDRGVEYTIEITGEEGDCYTSSSAPSENSFVDDEEDQICPRCGDSKYSYDDYCDSCTDEEENTCSNCGAYEYGVYGGLCSSCQDDEDDDW